MLFTTRGTHIGLGERELPTGTRSMAAGPILSQERPGGLRRRYGLSSISGSHQGGPSPLSSFLTVGPLSDWLARCEGVDVRFA
jgi:hypothetical protein